MTFAVQQLLLAAEVYEPHGCSFLPFTAQLLYFFMSLLHLSVPFLDLFL